MQLRPWNGKNRSHASDAQSQSSDCLPIDLIVPLMRLEVSIRYCVGKCFLGNVLRTSSLLADVVDQSRLGLPLVSACHQQDDPRQQHFALILVCESARSIHRITSLVFCVGIGIHRKQCSLFAIRTERKGKNPCVSSAVGAFAFSTGIDVTGLSQFVASLPVRFF